MDEASIRLNGQPVGILTADKAGALSFRYLPEWVERSLTARAAGALHAVSYNLPISPDTHGPERAGPYFDGLLPDNKTTRERLAGHFQIDASDDFNLLTALGRECPGAVSIVPMDMPVVRDEAVEPAYTILTEKALAQHIRELPRRPLFVDADGEIRLSLAGVHHKSALLRVGDQLALSRGRTPTSHILKVDIAGLPDSIRVENFCLHAARAIGLDALRSKIDRAEDQVYMLVPRYDRILGEQRGQKTLRRIHQEDLCQALGFYPRQKYEKDGGPGWEMAFKLMEATVDPIAGRGELLRRAVFQFLINNPDAHAKNYSVVYRDNRMLLGKLYDVNNAEAFRSNFKETRPRLAMFVGGERDPQKLTPDHWRRFADEVSLHPTLVMETIAKMARELPAAVAKVREEIRGTLADTDLLDIVVADVVQRCARVAAWS